MTAIPRAAVGHDLSERIRGRAEVEHLRRLVRGKGTPEDLADARAFVESELAAVALDEWGGPGPYLRRTSPHLRICGDLLTLRLALSQESPS